MPLEQLLDFIAESVKYEFSYIWAILLPSWCQSSISSWIIPAFGMPINIHLIVAFVLPKYLQRALIQMYLILNRDVKYTASLKVWSGRCHGIPLRCNAGVIDVFLIGSFLSQQ